MKKLAILLFGLFVVAPICAQPIPSSNAGGLRTTGAPVNVSNAAPPAGAGYVCVTTDATHCTWQLASGGSGTVTSVAATVPAFMAISGSPVTTSGTLAFSFASQAQGLIFASPCSGSGAVTFRALCAADIPNIAESQVTNLTADLAAKVSLQSSSPGTPQTGNANLSGTIIAGAFSGPLTGNVTGNVSGSSGSTTGNAATATALQTSRTINGDSFDGSANIQNTLASADFANQGTTTTVLHGNAAGNPAFAAVALGAGGDVSGTLPVANGGTSLTTLTANNVILGNGTSAPSFVAPSTSGNVLASNGTTWVSSTPTTGAACSTCTSNVLQKGNGGGVLQDSGLTESSGALTTADTVTQTSTSSTALRSGPNGATNPSFVVNNSIASAATGMTVTARAAGAGVSIDAISSGTNEDIALTGKGTGQIQVTNVGTAAKPALTIGASGSLQQNGFYSYNSNGGIGYANGGGSKVTLDSSVRVNSNGEFSFSSSTSDPSLADVRFSRCGVACFQYGASGNSSTPVDQVIGAQNGSGTNIAGGKVTYRAGFGTGTGAPGDYVVQSGFPLGTGTTLQSGVDRYYIRATPKTLTEGSATPLVTSIGIASNTINGGTLFYTIESNDGSSFQSLRGQVDFACTNNAGTVHCTGSTPIEVVDVPLTTTLTNAVTFTYGTNTFIPNLNASSSLTQTTLRATWKASLDGGTGTVNP